MKCKLKDISTEFFCQGGCEEHVLPEKGDHHGDNVVNQESNPLCEPGGGDPCAQHCRGTTEWNRRYQWKVLQVRITSAIEGKLCFWFPLIWQCSCRDSYQMIPHCCWSGLLGSSTKGWSCWTSHRQTLLSTSTRSSSSLRRALKMEVISNSSLRRTSRKPNWLLSSWSLELSNSDDFHHALDI